MESAIDLREATVASVGGLEHARRRLGGVIVAVALLPLFQVGAGALPAPDTQPATKAALDAYGQLPLAFVPNVGQADPAVRFHAHAGAASFFFTRRGAVFVFTKKEGTLALRLDFVGARRTTSIEARRPAPGRVNYLLGSDPAKWRTGLPTYSELVYRGLWPGIDLHVRGTGQLKYEFRVAPGARVSDIRFAYNGASGVVIDKRGNLVLHTPLGALTDTRPVTYQVIAGRRVPVQSRFAPAGAANRYGFAVGEYDANRALVIDPGLLYSTFLGGSADEAGTGIAVDGTGSAYVVGWTESTDFPTTVGAFDTSHNGSRDAFVTKLDPTGSTLVYSTFIGGNSGDEATAIALDSTGSAYVTGQTRSTNYPTTPGAYDASLDGSDDAFVTKLNPTGSALVYSTFLGGGNFDFANAIAVDGLGSAYVGGLTDSANFPTSPGAYDTSLGGSRDGFVTKLNAAGSAPLVYSTYLGGSNREEGGVSAVTLDAALNAHVTGLTFSSNFPTTPGAFDVTYNGAEDAFVTKLNATGSALLYSTFLGGSGQEQGSTGIALDASGNAHVTGHTFSANFPTTAGAFDTTANGGTDAFVSKLNQSGSALFYSTYLGGSQNDNANGIALDLTGSASATGGTDSSDFPTTPGAFDTTLDGSSDAYVTKLDPSGSTLLYSTYLGGSSQDGGGAIAVDPLVSAFVTGQTSSADFPTTPAAFDTSYNGASDAFATKLATIPLSTPLCDVRISDGGRITAANGDRATFGGHASVSATRDATGEQTYQDHGPVTPMTVKSIEVLAVVCSSDRKQADLYGRATIDGAGSFMYRIQVNDNAEPGAGADMYWITLDNGYSSGLQTLEGGNVQITVHE